MENANKNGLRKSARCSIRTKNLEDEECNIKMVADEIDPKTLRHGNTNKDKAYLSVKETVNQDFFQTPRRSCRKSIKPRQDYEDIVNNSIRSAKKLLLIAEEKQNGRDAETEQPKWTPAEVGRVSEKRGRKSKRTIKDRKENGQNNNQLLEAAFSDNETNEGEQVIQNEEIVPQCENIVQKETDPKLVYKEEIKENIAHSNDIGIEHPKETEEIKQQLATKTEPLEVLCIKAEYGNTKIDKINYEDNVEKKLLDVDGVVDSTKELYDSIQIIQENNEDYIKNESFEKEIQEKKEDEIQCPSYKTDILRKKVTFTFGSYLKSNNINISDLGLNPIKDEDEDKDALRNQKDTCLEDVEEMPSLILYDDDDQYNTESCNKLNETFEKSDCVNPVVESKNEIMEKSQLSDDCAVFPTKRPDLIVTDTELKNHSLLSTPKRLPIKSNVSSTPRILENFKLSTPKPKPRAFRFPTPHRSKGRFVFDSGIKKKYRNSPRKPIGEASVICLTTLEPKEIVLRGIRKRSLSVCIDGNYQNHHKHVDEPLSTVQDHPANKTATIGDLNIIITKNVKSNLQEKELSNNFVTTRRKRSLSVDESIMSKSLSLKLPRPVCRNNTSSTSTSTSKPLNRTKLPNFAAIHQKQFQKMENLVDHVSRKYERSQNLINSSTKLKPAAVRQRTTPMRNINISRVKPEAVKKIDLKTGTQTSKSVLNITTEPAEDYLARKIKTMPDPRLAFAKPIKSTSNSRIPTNQEKTKNKYIKTQSENIENARLKSKTVALCKPAFNLSTSIMVKSTNLTDMSTTIVDKATSRLKRHMDLFKGRSQITSTREASRRNEVILKGVRSNRRFELQMQHRKNLEQ